MPQVPQAVWGRCFSRQAGLAQVTNVGTVAFHWERRCRVLLRDIFLLGTATIFSLPSWDQRPSCVLDRSVLGAGYIVRFPARTIKRGQYLPPWIDSLLVTMPGFTVQVNATLDAETLAIIPA